MQGKRGALPSSTIMLRQPMQRFTQMQASDIDIYRNELRKTKNEIVRGLIRGACSLEAAVSMAQLPALLLERHACTVCAGEAAGEAHRQGE